MKHIPASRVYRELEIISNKLDSANTIFIGLDEAAEYLGLKKSYLYLLTHRRQIPFYKPNGKKVYFNKTELNEWILKSKIRTNEEVEKEYQSNSNDRFSLDNIQISAELLKRDQK